MDVPAPLDAEATGSAVGSGALVGAGASVGGAVAAGVAMLAAPVGAGCTLVGAAWPQPTSANRHVGTSKLTTILRILFSLLQ
jgi:hypothetical protein